MNTFVLLAIFCLLLVLIGMVYNLEKTVQENKNTLATIKFKEENKEAQE